MPSQCSVIIENAEAFFIFPQTIQPDWRSPHMTLSSQRVISLLLWYSLTMIIFNGFHGEISSCLERNYGINSRVVIVGEWLSAINSLRAGPRCVQRQISFVTSVPADHYSDIIMSMMVCVSIHRCPNYLFNCLFRQRSKKTSKLLSLAFVRGIHKENVSIWWHHHGWPSTWWC